MPIHTKIQMPGDGYYLRGDPVDRGHRRTKRRSRTLCTGRDNWENSHGERHTAKEAGGRKVKVYYFPVLQISVPFLRFFLFCDFKDQCGYHSNMSIKSVSVFSTRE